MGAVGETNDPRILVGRTAEKVVRQLPCSVITLKSESAIQLRLEAEIADIASHYEQGKTLLENGFTDEAMRQFQICIDKDMLFAPAWESLAAAHERLGHEEEAEKYMNKAKEIRQNLWAQKVVAEVRSRHTLWQKK